MTQNQFVGPMQDLGTYHDTIARQPTEQNTDEQNDLKSMVRR